jgi:hypothetical protein
MRYNYLGVGHSAALRKITRDCLGSVSVALADSTSNGIEGNEDDADHEEVGDGEGHEYDHDLEDDDDRGYEECDELSDGELDEAVMEDSDGNGYDDDDDDGDDDDDDDEHVSF